MSTAFHNPNLAELSIVVIVFSASSFKVQQHRRMRAARSPAVKDTVQTVDCIGAGSKSSQGPDLQEQQLFLLKMGRRPNAIVLAHFERGAKIPDNSNRYHHTCKNCGQEFSTGRHEQLTAHMTDVCPSLTDEQRARILLKLHGLENAAPSAPQNQNGTSAGQGLHFNLPFSPSRPSNFNGLNVLAEASRRVGIQPAKKRDTSPDRGDPPLDPALAHDLPDEFVNSDDAFEGYVSATNGFEGTSAPAYPPLFSYMPAQLANGSLRPTRLPGLGINMGSSTINTQPDLSSMAASANETLAHSLTDMFNSAAPQASDASFAAVGSIGGDVMEESETGFLPWTTTDQPTMNHEDQPIDQEVQDAAAFPRAIAINPNQNRSTVFVEETGTAARSQKAKQRSAFNPTRKKEVQEMRVRGVCIRCKMLKKPCGVDTPCKPCKEIDNSRLWGPCSRWDFKKDLKFYTTPLHSSLSQSDLNNIKSQITFQPFEGNILISILGGNAANMEVSSQQGNQGSHALHPQYGISMQRRHYQKSEDIFILSISRKEFMTKLRKYLDATLEDFCSKEKSGLICATLMMANKISSEKDHKLLKLVLELWVLTYILSSTELNTTFEAVRQFSGTSSPSQQYITKDTNPYSHSLLSSQLRAAVAERASEVKKTTMAAFEAQFMKGPTTKSAKNERFETFLASIILINAAERYMWLFKVFEQGLPDGQAWPLDVTPLKLAHQAEKVAVHLEFMLRVRHVSPGTHFGEDGILNFSEPIDENADAWFRTLVVREADLAGLVGATFDLNDFTSLDGKFFSSILQPPQASA